MASLSAIIEKAKQIQQPNEAWIDALKRAIDLLKNN
jgi:hypothetical protein